MKQVSATEARKQFFKLIDSAAAGETILIERKGVLLRLVPEPKKKTKKRPSYSNCLSGDLDSADEWTWDWNPLKGLKSKKHT
ncbi:MAG: type II toxin-antitoxin system Phd/YefM family antitoxin [Deltaproteobacteria bacterium]|nr:type II toxin-antitoxin system Phd/YefM family antitoxin [Deltaproteobacteria bacterium]